MNVLCLLKNAIDDESGAVTVDWVVLAAATVLMGTSVITVLKPGFTDGANLISSAIISATTF